MWVRIKLCENRIPQSRFVLRSTTKDESVMNLAFGLDNFLVRCEINPPSRINFGKVLPLVDKILSFM